MLKSLLVVLGVASYSNALQISGVDKVSLAKAGTFDPRNGDIAVQILKAPKKIQLKKEDQVANRWIKLNQDSPLSKSGLTAWAPTQQGFLFRNENNATTECKSVHGKSDDKKGALILVFHCEEASEKTVARFSEKKWAPSANFWLSCPDSGVPYGWSAQWGGWNYPYYAVTPQGYMGCDSLYNGGYCNNPYLYPWGTWDGYTYADSYTPYYNNYYVNNPYATWNPSCGSYAYPYGATSCYYQ